MLLAILKKFSLPKIPQALSGFELRLDYLEEIKIEEVRRFMQSCPLPLLFAVRKKSQGGFFTGTEKEREKLLERLFALNPPFFDLEYDTNPEFVIKMQKKHPEVKIVCSYHNMENTPKDLEGLFKDISRFPAFCYKIATFANNSIDAMRMLHFVQSRRNITGLCMGEYGTFTRILAPVVGCMINYASLNCPSAPGQLEFDELMKTYHYSSLNRETAIYALIGDPVEQSLSAIAHNSIMQTYGINGVYVKIRLKKEELLLFFSLAKSLNFKGLSITMPLKEAILPFIDQDMAAVSAINTIHVENDRILGLNTDGRGALDAIEKIMKVKDKKIVFIGAGGASKAIVHEALKRGAEIVVLNRTAEKAIECYKERGGGLDSMEKEAKLGYDILVNTTPEMMPIDPEWILPKTLVMDIKTRPKMTPFLTKALEKQCHVIYGMDMFIHQAAAQDKIWFKDLVNETAVQQVLYSHLMI